MKELMGQVVNQSRQAGINPLEIGQSINQPVQLLGIGQFKKKTRDRAIFSNEVQEGGQVRGAYFLTCNLISFELLDGELTAYLDHPNISDELNTGMPKWERILVMKFNPETKMWRGHIHDRTITVKMHFKNDVFDGFEDTEIPLVEAEE